MVRPAYPVDEDDAAARGQGASGDKSVDAVVIDDRASTVFVVQGKFRLSINQKAEQRSDVVAFMDLGDSDLGTEITTTIHRRS